MPFDVENLNEDELLDLHHRVVDRLNFLEQVRNRDLMLEFSIGDRVVFTPTGRPQIFGKITKYNKKTVSVITDSGQKWNVGPNLLERAPQTEGTALSEDNIVPIFKRLDGG